MEENEDEPEDVRFATPVADEIKKAAVAKEESDRENIFPKKRVENDTEENKKEDETEDFCTRKKRIRKERGAKWGTIHIFEKECKFPKLNTIPRHCLSKKEHLDTLAAPGRKCEPQCLKKPVIRKLKPISPRIVELARPPMQRILRTIEDRGDTIAPQLLDDLINMAEAAASLNPEQAAQLLHDKKIRSTKKCKKKKEKIPCQSKKEKGRKIENGNFPLFDPEAVCFQYLMAERFVKSILNWESPIPKEECRDIAEVILRRLSFIIEYTPIDDGDRKSQQMRFLADVISCWISGVLLEVAKAHKKELEEECERRKQTEEEMTEEEEDESEEESILSPKTDEESEGDENDKGDGMKQDDKSEQKYEDEKDQEDQTKNPEREMTAQNKEEYVIEEAGVQEEVMSEEEGKRRRAEEEEAERKRAEDEDEAKKKREDEEEAENKRVEEEEAERRRAEEEEAERKRAGEEEAENNKAVGEEEAERRRENEEEAGRKQTEEEEAERKRAEEEEAERERAEEEEAERKRAEEEEAKRKRTEEEGAERKRAEKEEAERRRAEEEEAERKRAGEEEAERKRAEEEEAEGQRVRAEAAEKIKLEEAEIDRKRAEEEEEIEMKRLEEEAAERKRLEEAEIERIRAEEEAETKRVEETERARVEEEGAERKKVEEKQIEEVEEIRIEEVAEQTQIEEAAEEKTEEEAAEDKHISKTKEFIPTETVPPIKVFQSDLPFVTFIKIFDTLCSMIEEEEENTAQDPVINRLHRAVYEKFYNAVLTENPTTLTDNAKDVIDVMAGKIAIWLSKVLTESQVHFLDKYPPEVESEEVRDWSNWIDHTTATAGNWSLWLQKRIEEVRKMQDNKVTRGQWEDFTQNLNKNAFLWRRFHLDTIHKAHHNAMMLKDREVVKTGEKKTLVYPEKELNVINLG